MTNEILTFDKLKIGRKFKSTSEIIYRKTSKVVAIPISDISGNKISDGKQTSLFYKSNVQITEVV